MVVVVVAAIAFVIWKKRRDEDEDSDDEGGRRLDPPAGAYNRPAPVAGTGATTYSAQQYQRNARLPAPQIPITKVTSPVAGSTAINYSLPASPGNAAKPATVAAVAGGAGGAASYSREGSYHFSDRGSDAEGDVWGHEVGSYREKRTHSNVSVEF